MLSAHALRTQQRTTDTLGIALPTRVGFGIIAGAGIHYPVLRRIQNLARLKSAFIRHRVLPESFFLAQGRCCFRTSAQDGNVFYCQAEARLELSVIEVDEPHADALLAGIFPGTNESANEA